MLVVSCILIRDSLDAYEIGGTPVAPPELSRDAPVLDTFEPAVPVVFGLFGCDEEFACFGASNGLLCQRLAVDPPLGFKHWLDNIPALTIDPSAPNLPQRKNTHLQIGICILLSCQPTYNPNSFNRSTTLTRA